MKTSRRVDTALCTVLLASWLAAALAGPAVAVRAVPPYHGVVPLIRMPDLPRAPADDSILRFARPITPQDYLEQHLRRDYGTDFGVDARSEFERVYAVTLAVLGAVALLLALLHTARGVWTGVRQLHGGQLVLIWVAGAVGVVIASLAKEWMFNADSMVHISLLAPVLVGLLMASIILPFAATWSWFGHRGRVGTPVEKHRTEPRQPL